MGTKNILKLICGKFRLRTIESMTSFEALQRLEERASQAESHLALLKAEMAELQKAADFYKSNAEVVSLKKFEEIREENEKLKEEVKKWKTHLSSLEKKMETQFLINALEKSVLRSSSGIGKIPSPVNEEKEKGEAFEKKSVPTTGDKVENKTKQKSAAAGDDLPVDVGRLDIRVGKIIDVKKHPDANSLYVEQVDLGEEKPRTVVSGLVKYVPIEEMENRMVVVLCNLKPAKMRGVTSEAMVLCASTPDKVEVLTPPEGSCPGDKIFVEGFPGQPDPVLNPKKKIFETVALDLRTDSQKRATFKGSPFVVPGKGVVTCQTLTDVQIK